MISGVLYIEFIFVIEFGKRRTRLPTSLDKNIW